MGVAFFRRKDQTRVMTYTHFFNCALLTFGPSVVIFRSSGLQDQSGAILCGKTALCYLVTQFLKLLLMATFIPSEGEFELAEFSLSLELMKSFISIIDAVSLYFIFVSRSIISSNARTKILAVGLGWATAESIVSRLAPLWIGARGVEFSWTYLITSMEGTVSVFYYLAFATSAYLWTKSNLGSLQSIVFGYLCIFTVLPSFYLWLTFSVGLNEAQILGIKAAIAIGLFIVIRFLRSRVELKAKTN